MQDFRGLKVWKKSHFLALAIYKATRSFPKEEMFGLTSQMRRAAASVPANLAEGCGRSSSAELKQFACVALGSASEPEYHLLLARELELLSKPVYEQFAREVIEVKRMLSGLIRRLLAVR